MYTSDFFFLKGGGGGGWGGWRVVFSRSLTFMKCSAAILVVAARNLSIIYSHQRQRKGTAGRAGRRSRVIVPRHKRVTRGFWSSRGKSVECFGVEKYKQQQMNCRVIVAPMHSFYIFPQRYNIIPSNYYNFFF